MYYIVVNALEDPAQELLVEPIFVVRVAFSLSDSFLFFCFSLVLLLFGVNDIPVGDQVDIRSRDDRGSVVDFVAKVHDNKYRQHNVTGDEVLIEERRAQEDSEVLDKDDQHTDGQGKVGAVRLKRRSVGQIGLSVDSLSFAGSHESDVDNQNTGPGNQTCQGNDIDKVCENFSSSTGDSHISQQSESEGQQDTVVWNTQLVGLSEELRSVSSYSQGVDSSGTNIHIRVSGGKDK